MNITRNLGSLISDTFKLIWGKFFDISMPLLIYGVIVGALDLIFIGGTLQNFITNISQLALSGSAFTINLGTLFGIFSPLIPYFIASTLLKIFVFPLVAGTLYTLQFSAIEGIEKNYKAAFSVAKKNYKRLLLTSLVAEVCLIVVLGLALLLYIAVSLWTAYFMSFMMLFLSIVTIIVTIGVSYALPATMAQRIHGVEAVRHSFAIFKDGGMARNIGHSIVIAIIFSTINSVISNVMSAFVVSSADTIILIFTFILAVVLQVVSSFNVISRGFMYINAQVDYAALQNRRNGNKDQSSEG